MITVDGIQVSFSQLRQKWRDGSVVVFNGDYHSSGLLTVDKSVTIRGGVFAQINVTAPNVVIEEVTVRDSIASAWNGAISVRANGCVVRKSHVYNAMNVNVFGILALNVDGCVVEGCEVHDVYYVGINVEAHAGKFARNNLIQNNTVYRTRGSVGNSDGIAVKSNVEPSGVIGNKVIGNVVFDTFDDGIDCWNSRDTLVEGNHVYNIKNGDGNGIKAGKGYGAVVIGNTVHDCKSAGLTSNGSGVRFESNVSYNNATGFSDNWRQAGYEKEKSYFLNNAAYDNGKNFAWGRQSVDEGGNVTVKPVEPPVEPPTGYVETNIIVHINYASKQTLRIRSEPSVNARVRGMIYPDPDIRWHVLGVFRDGGDYWGKLGEEMWFALKNNGMYFSDWRE